MLNSSAQGQSMGLDLNMQPTIKRSFFIPTESPLGLQRYLVLLISLNCKH